MFQIMLVRTEEFQIKLENTLSSSVWEEKEEG